MTFEHQLAVISKTAISPETALSLREAIAAYSDFSEIAHLASSKSEAINDFSNGSDFIVELRDNPSASYEVYQFESQDDAVDATCEISTRFSHFQFVLLSEPFDTDQGGGEYDILNGEIENSTEWDGDDEEDFDEEDD